jgi:RNA polymerase sigma-70 factor (ECF subfamily)
VTAERTAEAGRAEADAAIAAFVAQHYDRLLRLARLICRDASDAADAVQLGLEQAWRKRATLREETRVRPWLDRIVSREAVRISQKRESRVRRWLSASPEPQPLDLPDGLASEPLIFVALRAAFAQLPPPQRAAVALHLHLGYTLAETAAIVGVPEETVRSRLRLARQRLRRELEEGRP